MPKKRKQTNIVIENADGTKTRHRINYYTPEELVEKKKQLTEKSSKKISFSAIADDWYYSHIENIEINTANCYISPLKDCKAYFGDTQITDISTMDIQVFINRLVAQKFARQTVKLRLIVLNQVFDFAAQEGYVKLIVNPCEAVNIKKAKPPEKREPPTRETIEVIKNAVNDEEFGLIPFTVLFTGLRRNELLALDWEDFDFKSDVIHINKTLVWDGNKVIVKNKPKTESGYRDVPILTPLKAVLKPISQKTGIVFAYNGNYWNKGKYDKALARYKKKYGIDFCLHELRHEFATFCLDAELPTKQTQKILGHAKEETTANIYQHIRAEREKISAQKLNDFLLKSS